MINEKKCAFCGQIRDISEFDTQILKDGTKATSHKQQYCGFRR